jgi:hypothetical protein
LCDASDLYDAVPAMRKGWPASLPTIVGNGMPFIRQTYQMSNEGEVVYARYVQATAASR